MQSHFDMFLFGATKELHDEVTQLLDSYSQNGCHDELTKKAQGLDYNTEKCQEAFQTAALWKLR